MNEKKKILIVEDDLLTLESLRIKFTHAGIDVVQSESGKQAIDVLRSGAYFDLILLDLIIPMGDGFWFLEEKRKDTAFSKVPVIVISNLNQPEPIERARTLGAVGYLVKANHSLSDIVKIVEQCLRDGGVCTINDFGK